MLVCKGVAGNGRAGAAPSWCDGFDATDSWRAIRLHVVPLLPGVPLDPTVLSVQPSEPRSPAFDTGRVWGKSKGLDRSYPLVCHLVDAAMVACVLVERVCTPGQISVIGAAVGGGDRVALAAATAAGWHDLGKVMPGFQRLDPMAFSALTGSTSGPAQGGFLAHADAGCRYLLERMERDDPTVDSAGSVARRNRERFAQIVGGHHGVYPRRSTLDPRGARTVNGRSDLDGSDPATQDSWRLTRDNVADVADDVVTRLVTGVAADDLPPAFLTSGADSEVKFSEAAAALLTGVVVMADWLVSQEEFIQGMQEWHRERGWDASGTDRATLGQLLDLHAREASERAGDLVSGAGLVGPALRRTPFTELFPFEPRGIQCVGSDILPALVGRQGGIFVSMAPAGDGKTEAALQAATIMGEKVGASGVFIAMPTMATTDAMYSRVLTFCGRAFHGQQTRLSLMHGHAAFNDVYTQTHDSASQLTMGEEPTVAGAEDVGCGQSLVDVTSWLRGPRRAILAPNTVGTVDQVLAAALATKWNPLRLFGLSRKVVIIDEAHAYDAYMQALLRVILSWLGRFHVPVVLLSATMSAKLATSLVHAYMDGSVPGGYTARQPIAGVTYPGWIYYDTEKNKVTAGAVPKSGREHALVVTMSGYQFTFDDVGPVAVVTDLLGPILSGRSGNALVVCNTVGEAIRLHTRLAEQASGSGVPVILMHARFPVGERARRSEWLERHYGKYSRTIQDGQDTWPRPDRSIVVSTQVVEASLDVDFDVVISELAPVAALLQRAGRGHRHLEHHLRRDVHGAPCGESVPTTRPTDFPKPHLYVLVPVKAMVGPDEEPIRGACGALYPRDERPYQQNLLNRTYLALTKHFQDANVGVIAVPEDVQGLVDEVDGDGLSDGSFTELLAQMNAKAQNAVMANAAGAVSIPSAPDITDLASLTSPVDADDALAGFSAASSARASARYNINTITMLPAWESTDGALFLDASLTISLPTTAEGGRNSDGPRRFSTSQIRTVVEHTISIPAWDGLRLAMENAMKTGPCRTWATGWAENSTLKEVQVAVFAPLDGSTTAGPTVSEHVNGKVRMRLSKEQGLDMSTRKEPL